MTPGFGRRLAEARKRRRLTQLELAVALGHDHTTISHVEAGHNALLLSGVAKAAQELRVSVDWLVGLTDDPTPAAELTARVAALERRGAGGRRQ